MKIPKFKTRPNHRPMGGHILPSQSAWSPVVRLKSTTALKSLSLDADGPYYFVPEEMAEEPIGEEQFLNLVRCPNITPLPGTVVRQYRVKNGKRYGPYFFRVWRENLRQKKAYVRPQDVADTRTACRMFRSKSRSFAGDAANLRKDFDVLKELLKKAGI